MGDFTETALVEEKKLTEEPKNAGTYILVVLSPERDKYYKVDKRIIITIEKADQSYEVPTGLTAGYGQKLSDVELPEGFTWTDETQLVGDAGTSKVISATRGKTYYYKVRAYRTGSSGTVYGPWSYVRSYKIK